MDIYTMLVVIAFLALTIGIAFIWHRSTSLFDAGNPFNVIAESAQGWLTLLHN